MSSLVKTVVDWVVQVLPSRWWFRGMVVCRPGRLVQMSASVRRYWMAAVRDWGGDGGIYKKKSKIERC